MSYVLVRIYSGSADHSLADLMQIVARELRPQLIEAGCQRYTTFILEDGRFGSTSLYDSKAVAQRGTEIAAKWVKEGGAMQSYSLAQTLRGEVLYSHQTGELGGDMAGEVRIYQTTASAADLGNAFNQEADPIVRNLPGLVRYAAIHLDDGQGCAVLTAHRDRKSATAMSNKAREVRQQSGSQLQSLLPQDQEILPGLIFETFTA